MSPEKNKQIADEVEKTLHAFDHDPVIQGNPFLFTRIQAAREERFRQTNKGFIFGMRPGRIAMAALFVLNIVTLTYFYQLNTREVLHENVISALQEDFQIDLSSSN